MLFVVVVCVCGVDDGPRPPVIWWPPAPPGEGRLEEDGHLLPPLFCVVVYVVHDIYVYVLSLLILYIWKVHACADNYMVWRPEAQHSLQ